MADKEDDVEVEEQVIPQKPVENLMEVADRAFDERVEKEDKDEPAESDKESKEEDAEEAEKPDDKDGEDKAKPEDKPEGEEADGYYADEGDVEEPEDVAEEIKEEWKNLSPLQRYLAENIPPLTIQGSINGKDTSLQVYAVENIPENFEFASRATERQTLVNLARMDAKAQDLERQFDQQQQQRQATQFTEQENRDIQTDIAELQRSGELPLFTKGTNVDEDPKAETAREVLDFYNKENQSRAQAAQNQGRLFHHLSYRDAYFLWKSQNSQVGEGQKAEDKERKEISSRTAKSSRQGAPSRERRSLNLPRTANWDQVINAAVGE